MPGTAACHHDIAAAVRPQTDPVCDPAPALDPPVARRDPPPAGVPGLVGPCRRQRPLLARGWLRRHQPGAWGEWERPPAPRLSPPPPRRPGLRRGRGPPLGRAAAARRLAPPEARAGGLDAPDRGHGVGLCLPPLPGRRWRRAGWADAAARGVPTGAAAASETPSRGARAGRERVGAAPRVRRAPRRAGPRTGLHGGAGPGPLPHTRPWPPWRGEGWRDGRQQHRRAAGVGRGPGGSTGNRRAVRGFPSIRHAALRAWPAAAHGGTSGGNASRVTRVPSRNAIGRDGHAVNRQPALGRASCHGLVMAEAPQTRKKAG